MTHTYALLEVSPAAHEEISDKLREAGYDHAFDGQTVDMHGIALVPKQTDESDWQLIRHLYTNNALLGSAIDVVLNMDINHDMDLWRLKDELTAKLVGGPDSGKAPVSEG